MSAPATEGTERLLDCNLVMKGGVTSGVVYPAAIQVLQRRFRFRSIGGASAGAIAAAAAAAAEYARQNPPASARGPIPPGFPGLAEVEKELGGPKFFQERFVPEPACRGLFRAFMKALEVLSVATVVHRPPPTSPPWVREREARKLRLSRVWKLLRALLAVPWRMVTALHIVFAGARIPTLLGFGLALFLLRPYAPQDWEVRSMTRYFLLALAGLTLSGLAVGGGWLVMVALRLERKLELGFGICSGRTRKRRAKLALTDWLHDRLNQLAGYDPSGPSPTLKQLAKGGVTMKVVTTNLTLAQPMVLPAQRGGRSFFFRRDEMERLFPEPVVEQLLAYAKAHPTDKLKFKSQEEQEALLIFPLGDEIPLLVATRMSLSFPVLLSAVRLYSFRDEAYQRSSHGGVVDLCTDVEEHWFSDGGIANNFPIHVFDSWVPDRPTLGITLYDSPVSQVLAQQERLAGPAPEVDLPDPADFERARPPRFAINGLGDFLGAIFNTARSYRDTLQSSLPSYRERIAQVFLQPDEGGLNLNMTPATVERIVRKGEQAGERLVERYAGPVPADGSAPKYAASFREHLWVRLYVLFEQFETELAQILAQGPGDSLRKNLFELMEAQAAAGERPWYLASQAPEWCERAKERAGAFLDLLERHRDARPLFSARPPSPKGILRVTPEV